MSSCFATTKVSVLWHLHQTWRCFTFVAKCWPMSGGDSTPMSFSWSFSSRNSPYWDWNQTEPLEQSCSQQMIPEEGRVSHISFEQDKKLSARRYYDLRTTVINSMRGYTNIITIASQPPAWFFSPKALTLSFKECLREINYCDNSSFRNHLR